MSKEKGIVFPWARITEMQAALDKANDAMGHAPYRVALEGRMALAVVEGIIASAVMQSMRTD